MRDQSRVWVVLSGLIVLVSCAIGMASAHIALQKSAALKEATMAENAIFNKKEALLEKMDDLTREEYQGRSRELNEEQAKAAYERLQVIERSSDQKQVLLMAIQGTLLLMAVAMLLRGWQLERQSQNPATLQVV